MQKAKQMLSDQWQDIMTSLRESPHYTPLSEEIASLLNE
jgi:hypothetical protein